MEPRTPGPAARTARPPATIIVSYVVSCAEARTLISAGLDGETTGDEDATVDHHLAICPACAAHRERAAELRRRMRLRPSGQDTAQIGRILAHLRVPRLGRGGWMRPVLAWLGIVVVAQSFAPLVLGHVDGASAHIARHVGASGVALACGLLYAAWRPHRASGLLPFVGALCLVTVLATVLDTLDGRRSALAEATHVAEVLGMLVLWFVAGSPGLDRVLNAVRSRRSGRGALRSTT